MLGTIAYFAKYKKYFKFIVSTKYIDFQMYIDQEKKNRETV